MVMTWTSDLNTGVDSIDNVAPALCDMLCTWMVHHIRREDMAAINPSLAHSRVSVAYFNLTTNLRTFEAE